MDNIDSIPVVSQVKSLVQVIGGDAKGALDTQENFAYRNTFPVVSQIASLGYAIDGKLWEAKNLQEKFAQDLNRAIDSIPLAGHVKGTVHYALGQNEQGDKSMKDASRTTAVIAGGAGGMLVGGPAGAVAGGVSAGAAMDSIVTGSEVLIHGPDNAKPYGYYKLGNDIANGKINSVGKGFDAAMVPVLDGVTGLAAGAATSGIIDPSKAAGIAQNSLVKPTIIKASSTILDIITKSKKPAGQIGPLVNSAPLSAAAGGVAVVAGLDTISANPILTKNDGRLPPCNSSRKENNYPNLMETTIAPKP